MNYDLASDYASYQDDMESAAILDDFLRMASMEAQALDIPYNMYVALVLSLYALATGNKTNDQEVIF